MCFSSDSSLFTFITGIISSLLLIYYGNKKYNKENLSFGLFFIYVSFMQLFDYLFWNDLDNKKKINEKITLIAPIFNWSQPLFIFIVKLFVYKNFNLLLFNIINFIYFICISINYYNFITNEKELITTVNKENHLLWRWKKYLNKIFYLLFSTLNIFYLTKFKYSLFVFILGTFSLILSNYFFKYETSEIWCFFGVFIPLIMIPISYLI
jgi:hypothetical protein